MRAIKLRLQFNLEFNIFTSTFSDFCQFRDFHNIIFEQFYIFFK
eukprot:01539.XXX_1083_1239_1 [CDS] Oithona nana genome sequencing.